MHKVTLKAGTLSAAKTLHTKRQRANENIIDVPVAAEAQTFGIFPSVEPDRLSPYTTVVRSSSRTGSPTVVRVAQDGELLAANSNQSGVDSMRWIVIGSRYLAGLWAAFSRERAVARAASKLAGMSDRQLHDIGIQRSDIDLAVRFGRPNLRAETPASAGAEAER
jgi:uncharacterized protein YjiS (DUF1127 family)